MSNSAFSCNAKWNIDYQQGLPYTAPGTYVDAQPSYSFDLTTLCDGMPRVLAGAFPAGSTYITRIVPTPSTTRVTIPQPTCGFNADDCRYLNALYLQAASAGIAKDSYTHSPPWINLCSDHMTSCRPCTIGARSLQLFYWALPSTAYRDMCASTINPSQHLDYACE
jgi:hypothetical protein